jgi:ATP-dependent RNA helicase RhlE
LAQTGTGKTAAFALPILERLLNRPRGNIGALIISPTRELAEQICQSFDDLGQFTDLRTVAIYGGIDMDLQNQLLKRGVEIAVGCPGRIIDHLWKGTIDISHVEVLVIDEADRLFDMGFLPDIRNILKCILQERQTLLFSATMPNDIRHLVKETMHDPVTVQIGRTAPAKTVLHTLYPVKQHLKTSLLIKILHQTEMDSVIIFTRTKHRTEDIAQRLKREGFKATSLQGDLSQQRRQSALDGFRNGRYKILVATDIAARGIDVLQISHVINYDMPDNIDDYIHRIGRTGRVDKKGDAFSLITKTDQPFVQTLERVLKTRLEQRKLDDFNYTVPGPRNKPNRSPRRSRVTSKAK